MTKVLVWVSVYTFFGKIYVGPNFRTAPSRAVQPHEPVLLSWSGVVDEYVDTRVGKKKGTMMKRSICVGVALIASLAFGSSAFAAIQGSGAKATAKAIQGSGASGYTWGKGASGYTWGKGASGYTWGKGAS